MLRALIAGVCVLATFNAPLACTAVNLVATDKAVIAGRTMEWAFDMQWTLVSLPKGTTVAMSAPPSLNLPTTTAASKYAVVGVKPATIPGDTLLEGHNSAGLGMSGNFLPGFTEYQTVTPQDKSYVSILGTSRSASPSRRTAARSCRTTRSGWRSRISATTAC
jgi:penicillin V acylase-like amidase (Ntn superfamily)